MQDLSYWTMTRVVKPAGHPGRGSVDRALAAHCTSCSELDRALSARSLGKLLFPWVPWVMASLTTTLQCGTLFQAGAILVFCTEVALK